MALQPDPLAHIDFASGGGRLKQKYMPRLYIPRTYHPPPTRRLNDTARRYLKARLRVSLERLRCNRLHVPSQMDDAADFYFSREEMSMSEYDFGSQQGHTDMLEPPMMSPGLGPIYCEPESLVAEPMSMDTAHVSMNASYGSVRRSSSGTTHISAISSFAEGSGAYSSSASSGSEQYYYGPNAALASPHGCVQQDAWASMVYPSEHSLSQAPWTSGTVTGGTGRSSYPSKIRFDPPIVATTDGQTILAGTECQLKRLDQPTTARIQCPRCGKFLSGRECLSRHKKHSCTEVDRTVNPIPTRLHCPNSDCEKSFTRKDNRDRHVRKKH